MYKLCKKNGCGGLVRGKEKYCQAHAHLEKAEKKNASRHYNNNIRDAGSQKFYESPAWRRLRKIQLGRYPMCQLCMAQGKAVPAVIVDHIIEIKDGGAALDLDNLQSACRQCHNTKTASVRKNRSTNIHDLVERLKNKPTGKGDSDDDYKF